MIHYYYRRTRRLLPKRNKYSDCSLVHTCLSSCPLLSPPPKNVAAIFISLSTILLLCTPSYANMIPILYFKVVHTSRASENITLRELENPLFHLSYFLVVRGNRMICNARGIPITKSIQIRELPCSLFFFVIRHNDARTQSAFLSSFLRKKVT